MTGPDRDGAAPDVDLADLLAADVWFDAVAAGDVPEGDQLAADLVALMAVYAASAPRPDDAVLASVPASGLSVVSRRRHVGRIVAVGAAAAVLGLGAIGVAAATPSSPLYRVHRVIFGDAKEIAAASARAERSLVSAEEIITQGQASGGLTDVERQTALRDVAAAQSDLEGLGASTAVTVLRDRAVADRRAIDELPATQAAARANGEGSAPGTTGANRSTGGGPAGDGGATGARDGSSGSSGSPDSSSGSSDKRGSDSGGGDSSGSSGSSGHSGSSDSSSGSGSSDSSGDSGSSGSSDSSGSSGSENKGGSGSHDGGGSGDSGKQSVSEGGASAPPDSSSGG